MPAPSKRLRTPKYRLHRQSGQGIVTLSDAVTRERRDVLLGPFNSPASLSKYRRVVLDWETAGRRLSLSTDAPDRSVVEVLAAFLDHAEKYYRDPDGNPTHELKKYKALIGLVDGLYGDTPANMIDQRALKAIRQRMISDGLARKNINDRIGKIKHIFRWAAEEQLVPASVYHALSTVTGLKLGRSEARETEPIKPVPRSVVEQTLTHLTPLVADMVRLQLETGMRPGELVITRACDIDMTGKVWLYRPQRHKTRHFGHERVVPIGPRAQAIIRRYLSTDMQAFLFSPAAAIREQNGERRRNRKTPLWDSHVKRLAEKRVSSRQRPPGDRYDVCAYAKAITRACDLAFPPPAHLGPQLAESGKRESKRAWLKRLTDSEKAELRTWRHAHRWHPHQLRHTRALEIKREAGLDVARAVLGHRSPQITEMYATLDVAKATEVMARLG